LEGPKFQHGTPQQAVRRGWDISWILWEDEQDVERPERLILCRRKNR
jgi:hypothetical protein